MLDFEMDRYNKHYSSSKVNTSATLKPSYAPLSGYTKQEHFFPNDATMSSH